MQACKIKNVGFIHTYYEAFTAVPECMSVFVTGCKVERFGATLH